MPASDASNFFKRRGRRSPKLYAEYVGEFHCHPALLIQVVSDVKRILLSIKSHRGAYSFNHLYEMDTVAGA